MDAVDDGPMEVSPRQARQGGLGSPVLLVLVGGLILAAVVWGLVEIYGNAIEPANPVGDPSTAPVEQIDPARQPGSPG